MLKSAAGYGLPRTATSDHFPAVVLSWRIMAGRWAAEQRQSLVPAYLPAMMILLAHDINEIFFFQMKRKDYTKLLGK